MAKTCSHLDTVAEDVTPSSNGCEDCLRMGGRWLHLRLCMRCGHVGCCDNSPNRHATAHWQRAPRPPPHPVIRAGRELVVVLCRRPDVRRRRRPTGALPHLALWSATVLEAVIFDLDGVLVDSEPLWNCAKQEVVEASGGHWREDAPKAMIGMSSPEWSAYIRDELGVPLKVEAIDRLVVQQMEQSYRGQLPLLSGAVEAVRRYSATGPSAWLHRPTAR